MAIRGIESRTFRPRARFEVSRFNRFMATAALVSAVGKGIMGCGGEESGTILPDGKVDLIPGQGGGGAGGGKGDYVLSTADCKFDTSGQQVTAADGLFFLNCPMTLQSIDPNTGKPIFAPGISEKKLTIVMGTDSTRISFDIPLKETVEGTEYDACAVEHNINGIDIDGDGVVDIGTEYCANSIYPFTFPQGVWYNGLINTSAMGGAVLSLTPQERETYVRGCYEELNGIKPFAPMYQCPEDSAETYLVGYKLEAKFTGSAAYSEMVNETIIPYEDLYTNPDLVTAGAVLGTMESPLAVVLDPKIYAEDTVDIIFTPRIVADARLFKGDSVPFRTWITAYLAESDR